MILNYEFITFNDKLTFSWITAAENIVISGAEDGAITIGNGENLKDVNSFWYIGGSDTNDEGAVADTLYLNVTNEDELLITTGKSMIIESFGHCVLNTNQEYDSSNNLLNQVFVIGGNGKQGEKHHDSVLTYCKKNNSINEVLCGNQVSGFEWNLSFPSLNIGRDGHACTIFHHENYGLAALVAQGYHQESEIFLLEKCATCSGECEECKWKIDLDGKNLKMDTKKYNTKMITLNGVPFLFGGMDWDENDISESNEVFYFEDNEWLKYIAMNSSRQRHLVIPVSLEFLCQKEATSSTERYRIFMFYIYSQLYILCDFN